MCPDPLSPVQLTGRQAPFAAEWLTTAPLHGREDLTGHWGETDCLLLPAQKSPAYLAGFANSDRCVRTVQHLRYEVFNLELGHGLESSADTGLDQDEFDTQMTHIVVLERATHRVVGTYRVQTVAHALAHRGIYSAQEYDMASLSQLFGEAVECGRACTAVMHRKPAVLMSLWAGLSAFMLMHGQRYVFGCCSLNSADPDDGWRTMKTLRAAEQLHPRFFAPTTPSYSCGDPSRESAPDLGDPLRLPKLFRTYMRLPGKVVSHPALDREFGCIDFLVLVDVNDVDLSFMEGLR
jgi:putative hemolysin